MLLTIGEITPLIETHLTPAELLVVAERVEAEVVDLLGAVYVDTATTISETRAGYQKNLFLKRKIATVTTVTEYDSLLSSATGQARTEGTHFYIWPDEGRLEHIGAGGKWSAKVVVAYVPQDDRPAWKSAMIDLIRIELARTAMVSESVAGELSYTAPANWEKEKVRILRRISFAEIY